MDRIILAMEENVEKLLMVVENVEFEGFRMKNKGALLESARSSSRLGTPIRPRHSIRSRWQARLSREKYRRRVQNSADEDRHFSVTNDIDEDRHFAGTNDMDDTLDRMLKAAILKYGGHIPDVVTNDERRLPSLPDRNVLPEKNDDRDNLRTTAADNENMNKSFEGNLAQVESYADVASDENEAAILLHPTQMVANKGQVDAIPFLFSNKEGDERNWLHPEVELLAETCGISQMDADDRQLHPIDFHETESDSSKWSSVYELNQSDSPVSKPVEELDRDATNKAVALLATINPEEWALIDARELALSDDGAPHAGSDCDNEERLVEETNCFEGEQTNENPWLPDLYDLLNDAKSANYVLSTSESNLLLSGIVISIDAPPEALLGLSLHIYDEMKNLSKSGRKESAPDSTTYQILILALNRRFHAQREATRLFEEMITSSTILTAEAFLAGMQACYECRDVELARRAMESSENDKSQSFQPSVGANLIFLDLLKYQNSWRDALDRMDILLKVRETNIFSDFNRRMNHPQLICFPN